MIENKIQGYLALASVLVFLALAFIVKKKDAKVMLFGKPRKKDFWLLLFGFFYIYHSVACVLPTVLLHMEYRLPILESELSVIGWIGVNFCVLALLSFAFLLFTKDKFTKSRSPMFLPMVLLLLGVALAFWDGYFFAYFFLYLLCAKRRFRRAEKALESADKIEN